MNTTPFYRWSSSCLSDVGKVRTVNEDACLNLPEKGLWVVADGMGGHDAGDVASRMIVDSLQGVGEYRSFSAFLDDVEDRLISVNGRLVRMAREIDPETTIGSTVAALLAFGHHCICLWAGDSRVYRFRNGKLEQISQDHSEVEELIRQGVITPEDAENYPSSNIIIRAVGSDDTLYLDADLHEIHKGDHYLLCSDGLNKEVTDEQIAEFLSENDSAGICRSLVDLALERGCHDNVTVVTLLVEED